MGDSPLHKEFTWLAGLVGEIACPLASCCDCRSRPYQKCQGRREAHSLVRLTLGVACKIFISSVASDTTGEAALFRLLLEALAGANEKGKPSDSRTQWKTTCTLEEIVEVSQVKVWSDLLLLVPMIRFPCLGWSQGEM